MLLSMQVNTCMGGDVEMDETHFKIMKAAMDLITEKGYDAMTTKDIAKRAGVNESTLFRKFEGKQDIVLTAMDYKPWHPHISENMFLNYVGAPEKDLIQFAKAYLDNVTPYFVDLSIGLRSPQLKESPPHLRSAESYEDTTSKIMKVPKVFKDGVKSYFNVMVSQKIIRNVDTESAAVMFLSICFGFVFFKASFKEALTELQIDEYIQSSVKIFVDGLEPV